MKYRWMGVLPAAVLAAALLSGCDSAGLDEEKEYRREGIAQMEAGDYAEAAKSFEAALTAADGAESDLEEDISYYLALAYYADGRPEEAIAVYTGMINAGGPAEAWYQRGLVYLEDGKTDAAEADFAQAAAAGGDDYDLLINIYRNLADAGEEKTARGYLEQGLGIEGEEPEDLERKGYLKFLLGEYEQAEELLQAAVDRDYIPAMLNLGIVRAAQGDTAGAKASMDEYAFRMREDPDAQKALGDAAAEYGMPEQAIGYYEQALAGYEQIEGSDTSAAEKAIIAAWEMAGDYQKACELAEVYAEKYPEDAEMAKELEFLRTRV